MTATAFFFSVPMLAILGLCIGSFVNVVVYRLPIMIEQARTAEAMHSLGELAPPSPRVPGQNIESLARPSACPHCGARIGWLRLTPGLGWFISKGRCAGCDVPISPRYPTVEFVIAAVFGFAAWKAGPQPVALAWAGFGAALTTLALIKADTMLLPDAIVLPLLSAGLLLAAVGPIHVTPREAVLGAAGGYAALCLADKSLRLATGTNWMESGDMKLFAAGGAWLGWEPLTAIVLIAAVPGACFGIARQMSGRPRRVRVLPFGSSLAIAIAGVACWRLHG